MLREKSPEQVIEEVKEAGLRGRGGAGFPAGVKWGFVPEDSPEVYFFVNADESEPGTFKDRLLLECDPHQLIEGMIIAAYTIQADIAYIFIRAEYHLAARLLREALAAPAGLDEKHLALGGIPHYLSKAQFRSDDTAV